MIINYIATFINLMITGLIASLGNLNADNDSEHSYSVFKRHYQKLQRILLYIITRYQIENEVEK